MYIVIVKTKQGEIVHKLTMYNVIKISNIAQKQGIKAYESVIYYKK